MPSNYHYENGMPFQVLPAFYDTSNAFHATATAPTSPSSSSTTGSLLSSSADDYESSLSCSPSTESTRPHAAKKRMPKKKKSLEGQDEPKIARPPNAWILYRSKKLEEFKESNPTMYVGKTARSKADRGLRPTQASFSKQIASMWAAEPQSVKEFYHTEASIRSAVHAVEHPGYRFNPNKKRADKVKVKRERSKSGSPLRSSVPLTVTTPPPAVPSVLLTDFYTPASASSPALAIDQISPQQQQQQPHQWVLAPPTFTSQMPPPPPSSNASSLDSPYAQERRPSLKAQWEAIFPNEASDGSLSASSCSSSFPSSYRGTDSISPLWGMTLLPSLSISEPSYTDNSSLDMNLPGAFSLPSEMPEVEASEATPLAGLTSPAQFSFVPPALSLPSYSSSPNLEYWSSVPETAGLSPSTTPYFGLPAQATGNPPPLVNNPTLAQPALQVPDLPIWWAHRHVKVKPDEVDGIPLEDLIRQLNETKSS